MGVLSVVGVIRSIRIAHSGNRRGVALYMTLSAFGVVVAVMIAVGRLSYLTLYL